MSQPLSPNVTESKQPKGLGMLFFSEMWERFSFYGMRGLLVLYLTQVLFRDNPNPDATAFGIYGAYGALVYATPFAGGLLADKILGYKKAVMLGAVLMTLGHAAMALETPSATYVALAFLIVGNGFFKPNISSMVGGLYKDNDPRRDAGFTIFYMGINLGALLQLIPGYLGQNFSWSLGFGLAGVGMTAGLISFWRGKGVLGANGDAPNPALLKKPLIGPLSLEYLIYIAAFLSVGLFTLLVWNFELVQYVLLPVSVIGFGMVLIRAIRSDKVVRERLFVVLALMVFNVLFWAFFEQAGSSINLFTDRNVDRVVFGTLLPASVFQSVNPAFILLLAPLFSWLWKKLGSMGYEPSIPVKFALGLMQLGLGFLVLSYGAHLAYVSDIAAEGGIEQAATVPLFILAGGYLLHTSGELCLSPIGLSMITKLTPRDFVATVMGLWFLSTSLSHHFAAVIATLTSTGDSEGLAPGQRAIESGLLETGNDYAAPLLASFDQLASYTEVFHPMGTVAIGAGVLLMLISPLLVKWQHGVS